ncbi:hypothetical protein F4823DRAFT_394172 [Ustulina deusta]|nr:hypothetical protein F4823DRAFT_394172 [Ustulina deusta]
MSHACSRLWRMCVSVASASTYGLGLDAARGVNQAMGWSRVPTQLRPPRQYWGRARAEGGRRPRISREMERHETRAGEGLEARRMRQAVLDPRTQSRQTDLEYDANADVV